MPASFTQRSKYPSSLVGERVRKVYESTQLCSMATTGEDGAPHVNTAFFCYTEDLTVFFLSDPKTAHSRSVERDGRVALSIFTTEQAWGEDLVGIQVFGTCELATGDLAKTARACYMRRFPVFSKWFSALSRAMRHGFSSKFYAVKPRRIVILDESEFDEEEYITLDLGPEG